jgi:hypothetical protein
MVQKDFFDSIDPTLTRPVFGRFWGLKIAEISAVNKLSKKARKSLDLRHF